MSPIGPFFRIAGSARDTLRDSQDPIDNFFDDMVLLTEETIETAIDNTPVPPSGITQASGACRVVEGRNAYFHYGTPGSETCWGTNYADKMWMYGGNDVAYGLGGYDVIHAGHGDDQVIGGDQADNLEGQAGIDKIWGGDEFGEPGDKLHGATGTDELVGGSGDDVIMLGFNIYLERAWGEYGNDTIYGGGGEDESYGGFGDDLYRDGQNDSARMYQDGDMFRGGYGKDGGNVQDGDYLDGWYGDESDDWCPKYDWSFAGPRDDVQYGTGEVGAHDCGRTLWEELDVLVPGLAPF